ncbi:MAG: hypothetical protein O6952_00235, partial [Planctomycetota bacterium]|nr:hypothetical protein [Planctomycetota bacterium]
VDIVAGDELDLTPRLPLTLEPYLIHSDGLQVWLALRDPVGRVVQSLRGEGMVKAAHRGQLLFEEPISRLKYQYPAGMDDVDIGQVTVAATLRLGEKEMKWVAKAKPFKKLQAQSAEVLAPAALEGHA